MADGRTSPDGDDIHVPGGAGELLERNDDRARLTGLIDRVERGSGGLVVVEGPAGIGKTRLIRDTPGRGSRAWRRSRRRPCDRSESAVGSGR